MTALPYESNTFDYVLAWNVIYHGDIPVVMKSLSEIMRVLKPKGLFHGTMLSKRNTARLSGIEIAKDTWVSNVEVKTDKSHPHYYCSASELVALLYGYDVFYLKEDEPLKAGGSIHWIFLAEKM